jgi:PPOX class probable F420-dependent enzyme
MDDAVIALLKGRNFCHLITFKKNGDPRVVVIWVDTDGENVVVNGSDGNRYWVEDVKRDPRVIATVVNHDKPYEYVTVWGRVSETTHDGANDHIHRLHNKYHGTSGDTYPLGDGEQRIKVIIEPEKVRHYG